MPPPSSYMLLHECCSRYINIYPRDVCPCSATAKPLSRKVNFTFPPHPSPHPIHISHLSYTIHAIHQPSRGGAPDYLQQLSRVLNRTAGWLGLGAGRAAAVRIDILILHSRNRSMSDCGQKEEDSEPPAATNGQFPRPLEVISERMRNCSVKYTVFALFVVSTLIKTIIASLCRTKCYILRYFLISWRLSLSIYQTKTKPSCSYLVPSCRGQIRRPNLQGSLLKQGQFLFLFLSVVNSPTCWCGLSLRPCHKALPCCPLDAAIVRHFVF